MASSKKPPRILTRTERINEWNAITAPGVGGVPSPGEGIDPQGPFRRLHVNGGGTQVIVSWPPPKEEIDIYTFGYSDVLPVTHNMQVWLGGSRSKLIVASGRNGATGSVLELFHQRGITPDSAEGVQDGDVLGDIDFTGQAESGSMDPVIGARLRAQAASDWSNPFCSSIAFSGVSDGIGFDGLLTYVKTANVSGAESMFVSSGQLVFDASDGGDDQGLAFVASGCSSSDNQQSQLVLAVAVPSGQPTSAGLTTYSGPAVRCSGTDDTDLAGYVINWREKFKSGPSSEKEVQISRRLAGTTTILATVDYGEVDFAVGDVIALNARTVGGNVELEALWHRPGVFTEVMLSTTDSSSPILSGSPGLGRQNATSVTLGLDVKYSVFRGVSGAAVLEDTIVNESQDTDVTLSVKNLTTLTDRLTFSANGDMVISVDASDPRIKMFGDDGDIQFGVGLDLMHLDEADRAVGILTTTPARTLHVAGDDGIRIAPSALPGTPGDGDIVVDSAATNLLKWHDGTAWRRVAHVPSDLTDNRLLRGDNGTGPTAVQHSTVAVTDAGDMSGVASLIIKTDSALDRQLFLRPSTDTGSRNQIAWENAAGSTQWWTLGLSSDTSLKAYDGTQNIFTFVRNGTMTFSPGGEIVMSKVTTFLNTGLHILDTNASHDLIIKPGSNLTADRTLTITTGDANRTLTLTGDASLSGNEVTASAVIPDNRLVRGDGGSRGMQDSGITVSDDDIFVLGAAEPDALLASFNPALWVVKEGGDGHAFLGASSYHTSGIPQIVLTKARGTKASPAAVQTGDSIFNLVGFGQYDTTPGNISASVLVESRSVENWDASNRGSEIRFETAYIGETARTSRFVIGAGIQVGSPTGGDKGAGTINTAGDIYKNNSAYNNPDYVLEHAFTGQITKHTPERLTIREQMRDEEGEPVILEREIDNPSQIRSQDYPGLLPLEDVEAYCRENHQLPRIAQAKGMFERSDAVLEKLEEIHLYLFDLNKRLKALEEGNNR